MPKSLLFRAAYFSGIAVSIVSSIYYIEKFVTRDYSREYVLEDAWYLALFACFSLTLLLKGEFRRKVAIISATLIAASCVFGMYGIWKFSEHNLFGLLRSAYLYDILLYLVVLAMFVTIVVGSVANFEEQ